MTSGKIVRIQLSPLFATLLGSQEHLVSAARTMLDRYSAWLSFSGIPFFPEYTDHGVMHLSSVIETAEDLLSLETRGLLTSADAAVFVMAVILHDIAMHLTEDGFVRLVRNETQLRAIEAFGDKSWTLLWDEFRTEALRFSPEQNIELFGDPQPVPLPSLDDKNWTKKQFMLIGEFIRRHHPQLAHQIALYGFPGTDSEEFGLENVLSPSEKNLVGLIARSHGVTLRPCVDYLENAFFNRIDPLGIRAVFLMCLIRTADYFQLEATRSSYGLRIQSIRSTRSLREHGKHQAVLQVTRDADDGESFRVIVDPHEVKFVRIYLDLKNLFDAIQQSLDASWAILGEVFSRQTDRRLNQLGMSVRRLRSNLASPTFLKQVGFEPVHLKFTASETRLFKLLLRPLYGKDPDIGVRELVQNGIDAVRERIVYSKNHGLSLLPDDLDVVVDVEVGDDGASYVTVKDRGVGMTLEVIRDYFLKVGSSLRQSAFWKREFMDDQRRSSVLRTGYFGIGALATFLIGDEIEVVTRHVTSPQGLAFRTTMDSDPIQVTTVDAPIGTSIRIRQRSSDGNWSPHLRFFLKFPRVMVMGRAVDDVYPDVHDPLESHWQELPDVKQPLIRWARPANEFVNRVTLNGFEIEHGDQRPRTIWSNRSYGLRIMCPHLHILDYEGCREENNYINLARDTFFQDQFEPLGSVFIDLLKDIIGFVLAVPAEVLKKNPDSGVSGHLEWWDYGLVELQLVNLNLGFNDRTVRGSVWAFTAAGLIPSDGSVFKELGITTLLFSSHWHPSLIPQDADTALMLVYGPSDDLPIIGHGSTNFPPMSLEIVHAQCICLDVNGSETMRAGTKVESAQLIEKLDILARGIRALNLREEGFAGAWSIGEKVQSTPGFFNADLARIVMKAFLGDGNEVSPVLEAWKELLGTWVVPYDEVARKSTFAEAYVQLAPYISAWRALYS